MQIHDIFCTGKGLLVVGYKHFPHSPFSTVKQKGLTKSNGQPFSGIINIRLVIFIYVVIFNG